MQQQRNTVRRALLFLVTFSLLLAGTPASALGKKDKTGTPSYVPGNQWEAYFRNDEGLQKALVQPWEQYEDKDWMGLTFTPYAGLKQRLAVMAVENKSPNPYLVEVPLSSLEELLTTSLFKTNRFELVERKQVNSLIQEQDFGASGRVAEPTAAKIGAVLGAEYMIFAAINEWTPVKTTMGVLGAGKSKAEVAMSFRIVDATTSMTVHALTVRATAGSWGFATLYGAGMAKSSPTNYAVQACINKAAYQIATFLRDRPWRGAVIRTDGQKIYINAGNAQGMQEGTVLTALSKGEDLIDPTTGTNLGSSTEAIGSLQIMGVHDKFSIATVVQGCEGLKAGDLVEIQSKSF